MTKVTARGVSLSLSHVMAGHKVRTMPDGRIAVTATTARGADQAERWLGDKLPVGYVVIRKGAHLLHVVKREPERDTCQACKGRGERMSGGTGMGHMLMGECADCQGKGWHERAKADGA
jgi:hypothetical protein